MKESPPPLALLRDIGLFGGLDDSVLETFVQKLPVVLFAPGDTVFREGELGRDMFVVLGGEMEILKQSKREQTSRVAMLGPSDWFGEMSILDVMPRSATVRALAPAKALKLSAGDLDGLYRRDVKSLRDHRSQHRAGDVSPPPGRRRHPRRDGGLANVVPTRYSPAPDP